MKNQRDGWSIAFAVGPSNTDNVKMEKGSTELLFVPLKQRQDMTEDDWTQMMHWANKCGKQYRAILQEREVPGGD